MSQGRIDTHKTSSLHSCGLGQGRIKSPRNPPTRTPQKVRLLIRHQFIPDSLFFPPLWLSFAFTTWFASLLKTRPSSFPTLPARQPPSLDDSVVTRSVWPLRTGRARRRCRAAHRQLSTGRNAWSWLVWQRCEPEACAVARRVSFFFFFCLSACLSRSATHRCCASLFRLVVFSFFATL